MPPFQDDDGASCTISSTDDLETTKDTAPKVLTDSQEVEQCHDSNLWWIHGNGYDMNSFVEQHPGGKEAILLGKGRDCTALVDSYHAFSSGHGKILEKFLVVEKNKSPKTDFFYDILKDRVYATLKANGVDPQKDRGATWLRSLYYGLVILSCLATGHLYCFKGSLSGSFLFAFSGWLLGAMGHDAGHFAASQRYPTINEWGVWAISLIANPIMWQHQHTYGHHSFTNEFSHDPDLNHFDDFMRLHSQQKHITENQRHLWYVALVYGLTILGTCVKIPINMMQTGFLYAIRWQDQDRLSKKLGMLMHTAVYVVFIVVAPFFTQPSSIMALVSVVAHMVVKGWLFIFCSQINHINEASLASDLETKARAQHRANQDPRLADSWAVAQVETSNDFAPESLFWHIFANGLNLQIEHHLFPSLNHCHLQLIVPVVRTTCEEFGVQYKSYSTWMEIIGVHLQLCEDLSHQPSDGKED